VSNFSFTSDPDMTCFLDELEAAGITDGMAALRSHRSFCCQYADSVRSRSSLRRVGHDPLFDCGTDN
jgi:hypothetical protein